MVTRTVARGSYFRNALRRLLQEFPMSKFLRLTSLFSCLGVLVLGAIALNPDGPLPSSFRGRSAGRTSLAEAIAQREWLDRLQEASVRRLEAEDQIAEEVIARRRSLA